MRGGRKVLAIVAAAAASVAGSALAREVPAARAEGWSRTYVVEWYEPAMYYGAKDGVISPGTDCPAGTHASPDWVKVLMDAGYTRKEAEWLRDPANPTRSAVHGQPAMAFRGKDRQNVYDYPATATESGLTPVSGTIAEGLDLDDDASTGFTSPTGRKGIDNNFYKALGCWKTYRGPPRMSSGAQGQNDGMREGAWTIVVVVSGRGKDPLNDKTVEVGFYHSGDKIVRDGMGNVASDYTFSIKPHFRQEAIFRGETRNGRIIAQGVGNVVLRNPGADPELPLLKSKLELEMKPDGRLVGLIGGYRPWLPVYKGWIAARGAVIEVLTWVQMPDVWYALRRYADYSPSGPGGEKSYISYAMRVDAVPAYVMEPSGTTSVAKVKSYRAEAGATQLAAISSGQANSSGGGLE
ncbi:hypothetical protein [Sphingomonas sp.]|uniref:hypothetical protein n=1 Tax=Sphingomonas sp. TaxID=28214 RepID=UPI0035C7EF78